MYNNLFTGRKNNINTSGVPVCDNTITALNGVQLYSEGSCWIGSSGMNFTDNYGFPLQSGDSLFLPIRHPSDVYVRAPGSGVTVYWLLL